MNGKAGNGLHLSRHFQNAYVTHDIDAAARALADRHGIGSFYYLRDVPFGPGASIHIGLAWAGDVMIELIQPIGDAPNLYSAHLPLDGQRLRLHHLGHLIPTRDEWDTVVAQAERSGMPIVIHGNNHGLNYLYLDVRADAGHYLEYVHLDPPAARFFDAVPRN